MRRPFVTVACCLLALVACGGAEPASTTPAARSAAPSGATSTAVTSDAPSPDGEPFLAISAPKNDETIRAGAVQVTLTIRNFTIANKIGAKAKAGEGHIHYYLDVDEIPTTPGKEAIVEGEGRYVATTATSYTWNDVSAGRHQLGAQLIQNDHTPLDPPVTAEVTVTVR